MEHERGNSQTQHLHLHVVPAKAPHAVEEPPINAPDCSTRDDSHHHVPSSSQRPAVLCSTEPASSDTPSAWLFRSPHPLPYKYSRQTSGGCGHTEGTMSSAPAPSCGGPSERHGHWGASQFCTR